MIADPTRRGILPPVPAAVARPVRGAIRRRRAGSRPLPVARSTGHRASAAGAGRPRRGGGRRR